MIINLRVPPLGDDEVYFHFGTREPVAVIETQHCSRCPIQPAGILTVRQIEEALKALKEGK